MKPPPQTMIAIDQQTHDKAHAAQAGTTDLWRFPPLKFPPLTEWQEEDGAEADLTAPRLDLKSGTLTLHATTEEQAQAIISQLQQPREWQTQDEQENQHRITAPELPQGAVFTPLEVKHERHSPQLHTISVDFVQYQPPAPNRDATPEGDAVQRSEDFKMDGRPFSDYGARVLEGSTAALRAWKHREWHTAKHPLLTGQRADRYAPTRRKPQEVTVHLLWRASSLQQLHTNREAFLARLTLPEARQIDVAATGKRYAAIYKSEIVNDFYPQDAWLESSITFTIINEQEL